MDRTPLRIYSSSMNCFNKVIFLRFYNEVEFHILCRDGKMLGWWVSESQFRQKVDIALLCCECEQSIEWKRWSNGRAWVWLPQQTTNLTLTLTLNLYPNSNPNTNLNPSLTLTLTLTVIYCGPLCPLRWGCGHLRSVVVVVVRCGPPWSVVVVVVHCSPLWSVADRYGPLRSVVVRCGPLCSTVVCCGPLRSVAVRCSPLRFVVVRCAPLWSVVVRCGPV